jgi:hypothetical protein
MPFHLTNQQLQNLSRSKDNNVRIMVNSVIAYNNNKSKPLKDKAYAEFMKLSLDQRNQIEQMEKSNKPKQSLKPKKY